MKGRFILVIALMVAVVPTYGAVTSFDEDVDADGEVDPLTDGLLVIRYAFGFRGAPLLVGAVDLANCARCDAPAIEAHLASLADLPELDGNMLDIDRNGVVDPLTDCLLALRYLFGFRGATLVNGAVGAGCTLCTAGEIELDLAGLGLFAANDDTYRWVDTITDNALFWRFDPTYHPALTPVATEGVLRNDAGSGLAVALVGSPNLAIFNPDGSPLGTLSNVLMAFSLSPDGSFVLTHDIFSLDLGILQFFEGYTKFQYKLTDQEGDDILDENLDPITAWATIHYHPDTSHVATQYQAGMESLLESSYVEDGNFITPEGSMPLFTSMPVLSVSIFPTVATITVQPPGTELVLTLTTSLPVVTTGATASCPVERTYSEASTVLCCSVPVVAGACPSGVAQTISTTQALQVTGCNTERCGGIFAPTFNSVRIITRDQNPAYGPVQGTPRQLNFANIYDQLFDIRFSLPNEVCPPHCAP